jgi:hypothetical protein
MDSYFNVCHAVVDFPPRRPSFDPGSNHVRFVVDRASLGQALSKSFDFSCQFLFFRFLHIIIIIIIIIIIYHPWLL